MKSLHFLIAGLLLLVPTVAKSQADATHHDVQPSVTDSVATAYAPMADVAPASFAMTLPLFDLAAPGFCGLSPWASLYGYDWRLHEGFNAQLSMSLTAGFGKGAPHGVGFGQSAAFAYALPLSERFSVAVGVYADNMTWGNYRATDGGVAAAICYRLNDAVNLYAYGTKSFLPNAERRLRGFFPYGMPVAKDRVGAMAEIKVGKNAMIQVAVEKRDY